MKLLATLLFFFSGISLTMAQGFKVEHGEIKLEKSITFKTGTATLTSESDEALNVLKTFLDDKPYVTTLRIEGHVAGADNNQELSEKRALAVCAWLIAKGIDCKRLIAVGFGKTKPVAETGDPSNTRITLVNAAIRGRLIGGMPADGGGKVAGDPCAN